MSNLENTTEEQVLAAIARSIPEAIVFADLDGIIRMWNGGAEQVFGFTAADAVGQSLDIIVPEKLRKAHWDGYEKAVARGDTLPNRGSRITRALHKNGQPLYVDMSFAMARTPDNQLIGSTAVARDATARFLEEKSMRTRLAELPPAPKTEA